MALDTTVSARRVTIVGTQRIRSKMLCPLIQKVATAWELVHATAQQNSSVDGVVLTLRQCSVYKRKPDAICLSKANPCSRSGPGSPTAEAAADPAAHEELCPQRL